MNFPIFFRNSITFCRPPITGSYWGQTCRRLKCEIRGFPAWSYQATSPPTHHQIGNKKKPETHRNRAFSLKSIDQAWATWNGKAMRDHGWSSNLRMSSGMSLMMLTMGLNLKMPTMDLSSSLLRGCSTHAAELRLGKQVRINIYVKVRFYEFVPKMWLGKTTIQGLHVEFETNENTLHFWFFQKKNIALCWLISNVQVFWPETPAWKSYDIWVGWLKDWEA